MAMAMPISRWALSLYDNGQSNESIVFVYFGSSTGLGANGNPTNVDWQAEADQSSATLSTLAMGMEIQMAMTISWQVFTRVLTMGKRTRGGLARFGSASGLGANGTPANADYAIEAD